MKFSLRFLVIFFICVFMSTQVMALDIKTTKQNINASYGVNDIEGTIKMIKDVPEELRDSSMLLLMGNLYQDKNDNENAIFYYKQAILLDKNNDKAYYNLGNIFFSQEKYNLAIQNYKSAIKLHREYSYYYYNVGCAYFAIKDYNQAKNAFEKAIYYKNNVADFYYNLALTYKLLNNEKKAKIALNEYNRLVQE